MIVLENSFVQMGRAGSNRCMTHAARDAHLPLAAVCTAGALALAVAMGIGRFAFTPLLPLMQREGLLGSDGGAALAAANYLGYLVGALLAGRLAARPRRLVLASLLGTALVTAAAGWTDGLEGWLLLRAAAGVLSAWVMVGISSWAIAELARRGRVEAGGWVFAGVGLGIAAAGTLAWWRGAAGSALLWQQLGALALGATAVVAGCWRPGPVPLAAPVPQPSHGPPLTVPPRSGEAALIVCYGLFGFGYILPATYLPAMARAVVDEPRHFGLAWPVFGAAAALSTLLAGRLLARWRRRAVWAACHLLLAAGCALPLAGRSLLIIATAALAVGGSFMVATMAGMQLARARAAENPAPLLARMVAAFALGQIAGPLLALALSRWPGARDGITPTLVLATLAMLASAAWLHRSSNDERSHPHATEPSPHRRPSH